MLGKVIRIFFVSILLVIPFVGSSSTYASSPSYQLAVIFYSSGCTMCSDFIDSDLLSVLQAAGVTDIVKKEYLNDAANRKELQELNQRLGLPP
ncbi:MAG: hypothetical protein Q7O66_16295, partial [Dehalococcoidia bacterium]|nr:hypothetical protein [Dehalococcoidia bacterium]